MPLRSWTHLFPQYPGPAAPAAFRLVCAAVSGAALSLSYTGFYFSIYSWLCIGLLLVVILDVHPRIAFACGFVHTLLFVFTSVPWIATALAVHGGLPRIGESRSSPAQHDHRHLGPFLRGRCLQRVTRLDNSGSHAVSQDPRHVSRCRCRAHSRNHGYRPAFRTANFRHSFRPRRPAQLSGGYGIPCGLVQAPRKRSRGNRATKPRPVQSPHRSSRLAGSPRALFL